MWFSKNGFYATFKSVGNTLSNLILYSDFEQFYLSLQGLSIYMQLLVREGIDEVIASIDTSADTIGDRNWNKKKVRFCVQKSGEVSVI